MPEILPGIWDLTPLGALVGGLIMVGWLLSTGRWIPRGSHEREMRMAIDRGDEWKEAATEQRHTIHTQNETIREQQDTISVLAQGGQTAAAALGTLSKAGHADVEA